MELEEKRNMTPANTFFGDGTFFTRKRSAAFFLSLPYFLGIGPSLPRKVGLKKKEGGVVAF